MLTLVRKYEQNTIACRILDTALRPLTKVTFFNVYKCVSTMMMMAQIFENQSCFDSSQAVYLAGYLLESLNFWLK